MSFGSETGRTRSGTKGSSSKEKKQKKKKKQEFHSHRRAHFQESERHDPEEVRARTIIALDKLGHQVLSTEPGGYDLRAWMKSLNSLLDDFQEKVGAERISDELRVRRQEVALALVPSSSSEIDQEIEKLNREEATTKAELEASARKATSRRASLRDERDACAKELKVEREKLAEMKEERQSRAFFSRILKSGPSTEGAEARVEQLEAKLKGLEEEIDRSLKTKQATGEGAREEPGSPGVESVKRLEAVQQRLTELQSAKQASLQLAHEREIATKRISDVISSMKLDGAQPGASGT